MKIVHVSDIHIRNSVRYDEYEVVFNRLVEKVKVLHPDRIYLGGDIFHSKTITSPESTKLAHELFFNLANIAPVDIILGNHDLNLNNKDRLDCISTVVDFIENPKNPINVYKKSGIYKVADGFYYGVFSIVDKKGWPVEIKNRDDSATYISFFHGPISSSKLQESYSITTEYGLDIFKNYDFGLFGDIHKRQDLDLFGRFVYPGTLIQQDFSEDLVKGFYFWDIKSREDWKKTFISIENDFGFYTTKCKNFEDFKSKELKDVPSKPYFRVFADDKIGVLERNEMESYIISKFNAINVIIIDNKNPMNMETEIKNVSLISNIHLFDSQVDLIVPYINNTNNNVSEDDIKFLTELHRKYYNQTGLENNERNFAKSWKINRFEWSNLFAYDEDNSINFDNMPGLIGLFGANAIGKSSIPEAILWTIYNKTSKDHLKTEDVINMHKTSAYGRVYITHGSEQYVIERSVKKKERPRVGGFTLETALTFKVIDSNGIETILNDDSKTKTDSQVIRNKLGDINDALLSSFSSQFGHRQLIEMDQGSRKATIAKFLGIDIIEKIYMLATKDYNILKDQLYGMMQKNVMEEIELNNKKYAELAKLIKKTSKLIIHENDSIDKCTKDKVEEQKLLDKYKNINESDVKQKVYKLDQLRKEQKEIKSKMSELSDDYSKNKNKYKNLVNEINEKYGKKDLNDVIEKAKSDVETRKTVQTSEYEFKIYKAKFNDDSTSVNFYSKNKELYIDNKSCLSCDFFYNSLKINKDKYVNFENIDDDLYEVIHKDALMQFEDLISKIDKLQKSILSSQLLLEYDYNDFTQSSEYKSNLTLLSQRIQNIESSAKELEKRYSSNKEYIQELKSYVDEHKELINELNYIEKIKNKIASIQSKINEHSRNKEVLEKDILEYQKETLRIEGKLSILESNKGEMDTLSYNVRMYDIYTRSLHKDGIQSEIIKLILPYVNNEMKEILSLFSCNFLSEIEYDDEGQKINIVISKSADKRDKRIIELGSGAEQIITSIVMRIAFSNVSSIPSSDFFVIDEGFGALDSNNMSSLTKLLDILKNYYSHVIIISHLESVQEMVEYQIPIKTYTINDNGVQLLFSHVN